MAQAREMAGKKFGRLFVIERAGSQRFANSTAAMWRCRCDCGDETVAQGRHIRNGATRSCGCGEREARANGPSLTHGHTRGGEFSPEYETWRGMIERCANPDHVGAVSYVTRGITVCERWRESFEAFLADMGPRPEGKTIDRIDNSGPYSPENCRWATNAEQSRNKRNNHMLTARGETLCLADWAARVGTSPTTILGRLNRGWSESDAVTRPLRGS